MDFDLDFESKNIEGHEMLCALFSIVFKGSYTNTQGTITLPPGSNTLIQEVFTLAFYNDLDPIIIKIKQHITDEDIVAQQAYEIIRLIALKVGFTDGLALDLLRAWMNYEDIIFDTKPVYREHFIHQIYVFLLGCLFLDKLFNSALDELYHPEAEMKSEWKLRFVRRWFLASVFHDIGYPAEAVSEISRSLNNNFFNRIPNFEIKKIEIEEFEKEKNIDEIIKQISKLTVEPELFNPDGFFEPLITSPSTPTSAPTSAPASTPVSTPVSTPASTLASAETNPGFAPISSSTLFTTDSIQRLFTDEFRQTRDHGVMGSVFFLKTALVDIAELYNFYDPTKVDREKERSQIILDLFVSAAAIACHNIRSSSFPGYTIDFNERPIAALLCLCDEFQEWDRKQRDPRWANRQTSIEKLAYQNNNLNFQLKHKDTKDFKFKSSHAFFISSINQLFRKNLSDHKHVFFDTLTITGLLCYNELIVKQSVIPVEKDRGRYQLEIFTKSLDPNTGNYNSRSIGENECSGERNKTVRKSSCIKCLLFQPR
jgi:hypothetical protein